MSLINYRIIAILLVITIGLTFIPVPSAMQVMPTSVAQAATPDNMTLMQFFEWYVPADGNHWKRLEWEAKNLSNVGINGIWIPPAYKGAGPSDVGYGVYDLYDLGEFDQKGSVRTKYGTKGELKAAIAELKRNNMKVYGDVVMNHKASSDGTETVRAIEVDRKNRNVERSGAYDIQAYTRFWFPGRGWTHSSFQWNHTHFNGVDYDANSNANKIFKFAGKQWDTEVDKENGNYDYLMFADIDFDNPEVVNEMTKWGVWFANELELDGFRLDAVKHIKFDFMKKWVTDVRKATGKPMFTFGEYWSGNTQLLLSYLDAIDDTFSVLDVDLHHRFQNAANGNGNYDLKQLLQGTITDLKPNLSMTFVDNHDTQPGQALQSWVADWFKPQSYAVILTRQEGVPVVFYGDYYGIPNNNIGAMKNKIDPILIARKDFAYGKQNDYFDDNDVVGWTREGVADRAKSGLATVISDGQAGSKKMFVGKQHAGEVWFDLTNNRSDQVRISNTGWGTFPVNSKSLSIYVQKESFVPDNTPPSAPTQAIVKEKTDTSITISWNAATDNERVISYDIYRDNVKVQTTNETQFTDSGLTPETNYSYKIMAVDGAGNESLSAATVSGKTNATSGNVVTIYYKQGFTTPYIHYRPAGGQWTSPPGIAMKASEVPGYFKHTINLGNSTKLEACFNDGASNWDSNNRANYMIDAGIATFIPGSKGAPGTIKTGKPTQQNSDVTPPSAPSALKVDEKSKNTVSLSWSASRDNVAVQGYELYRDAVKIASFDATSYTDNGLEPNTSYVYTVKAFDAAGNVSATSTAVNVTTTSGEKTNSLTIYYKKGFTNPHIHYRTINGSWTDLPGVSMPAAEVVGYHKIDIDLGADPELEACFNNGSNVWDSNQSKNYKFSPGVYTFVPGANGNPGKITQGAPSGTVPGDAQEPSEPTGLRTTRVAMNQITLAWSPASDNVAIAGYEVYRNSIKVGTVNAVSFTDSGLAAGTPHTYTVRAIDSSGNMSKMSAEFVATTATPRDDRVDGSGATEKQSVLVVGKRITVNGKLLPSSVQPQTLNGRIMLPFKVLFEALGTKVSWNRSTRTLSASKTNFNMTMQANVRSASVNGKIMSLEVPPVIIRGTTYVPLRFVADSLGASVQYRAK